MENIFSQIDESVSELQNVLRQTKRRKRGPNLTEQNREDIYQAYLEKADLSELAKSYGVIESTIKKAIREKEEQQRDVASEVAFTVKLDALQLEPEVEPDKNEDFMSAFELEPELTEDSEPETEPEAETVGVETQPDEVEYVLFPTYDRTEAAAENGIVDEPEDESEKDIEIEALLVHYIFALYDANVLSPFEAATFIRRL